ncbi:hypothetical protein COOONC_14729 [Cooperia oncophora]
MLMSDEGSNLRGRHLTPDARAVIANVKQFFAQLKEHLGATARGTVLDSVTAITATACGVSDKAVERVSNTPVGRAIRRSAPKTAVMAAINNHGTLWGERIKRLVHELLKEEKDVTLAELHQQMTAAYPNFALSSMTLWRLMKGLGFSYKLLKGQRYIFERADLARKRSLYLRKVEEARERGDCVVYMDETWVFEGMVKRRGWIDNTLSRFPTAEELRSTLAARLLEEQGKARHCYNGTVRRRSNTRRQRNAQDDYHREMDHSVFEEWLSNTPVGRAIRRSASKSRSRKATVMAAINNHGTLWGERIKRLVHELLKEEKDVTLAELHQQMTAAYPNFALSQMTLWRLMKGLGFSYKLLKGQRYIFERADLARKRSLYLRKVEEARERGDCVVYMDETWVFEGMVKRRGWIDNTLSRFPTAEELRSTLAARLLEEQGKARHCYNGTVRWRSDTGCTHVFVSRQRTAQDEVHREDGSFGVRGVAKVRSPLHEGVRSGICARATNPEFSDIRFRLEAPGCRNMELSQLARRRVGLDSTKEALLEELDHFVASRGGAAALRCYAAEKICEEMGVSLLRLPPFHCFFNPVELCWSHLKQRLNKIGRPTDRLEIVKSEVGLLKFWESVTRQLCEGWCREAIREEDSARLKEALDANNNFVEDEDMSSSPHNSSDDSLTDESLSEFSLEL